VNPVHPVLRGGPVVRIPAGLRVQAAERLIAHDQPNRRAAAQRLVASAATHGIDLDLLWGVVDPAGTSVLEAALVVPGSGATGMMFVSCPRSPGVADGAAGDLRAAVIAGACADLAAGGVGGVAAEIKVVQCLPEPTETWTIDACRAAGMLEIGALEYLRRPFHRSDRAAEVVALPSGVTATPMRDIDAPAERAALRAALDVSYIDTLDCPELCGMRDTEDVIASHRSTGTMDPRLWWIVREAGEPLGCLLLNPARSMGAVELVYLGLGPRLRGRGLGRTLMRMGIRESSRLRLATMACAVDARNEPARKLYASLDFTQHGSRVPFVKAI
jgi:ribosomal protein S18 acetylase RimI-like enzyme